MLDYHYPSFELNFEEGMGGRKGEEAEGQNTITHPNSVCGGTNISLSGFLCLKPPVDAGLSASAKYIFQG